MRRYCSRLLLDCLCCFSVYFISGRYGDPFYKWIWIEWRKKNFPTDKICEAFLLYGAPMTHCKNGDNFISFILLLNRRYTDINLNWIAFQIEKCVVGGIPSSHKHMVPTETLNMEALDSLAIIRMYLSNHRIELHLNRANE